MERSSFEHGSWYEGPTALDELERARIMEELAETIQIASQERTSEEINGDPILQALLGKIINSGPGLDPDIVSHLRKIVALRIGHIANVGIKASDDAKFWRVAQSVVMDELETLNSFMGEELTEPSWYSALEDLRQLGDNEE